MDTVDDGSDKDIETDDTSDNDTSDNDTSNSDNDNSDNSDNDTDNSDNNDNDTNDSDKNDENDIETNDDRDGVSDLSAAILGSKNGNDEQFNTNASEADMQYYVKITLINMWLILGLIVVVNICFYWCYCRKTQQTRGIKKGFANDSSDALGGVSEEENM